MIVSSKVPKVHFQSVKMILWDAHWIVYRLKIFHGDEKVLDKSVSLEYNELIKNGIGS